MSTHYATASTGSPIVPHIRRPPFDPLKHAAFFVAERLQLTGSRQGKPQMVLEAATPEGKVRAGWITYIQERPETLGGNRLPPSLALSGRIAEYSDQQRTALMAAGVVFKAQQGDKKVFWTAYLNEDAVPEICALLMELKTASGKSCLLGQFTARAVMLFQKRHDELRREEDDRITSSMQP